MKTNVAPLSSIRIRSVFIPNLHIGLIFIALFSFQEILVAPIVFLAFLKMFLIPIKLTLMEDVVVGSRQMP